MHEITQFEECKSKGLNKAPLSQYGIEGKSKASRIQAFKASVSPKPHQQGST
ncbi:uncharacterized protein G2W53_042238 [Senna tora]|uniref:Uncharacterized protein n=1 Tax=Senna tora TaxID=362788 RepID=A0A834SGQ0_9FABA|nr:uncharacterized protein G2W53_042238 [Senna tora]